jgi:hypothetical protein
MATSVLDRTSGSVGCDICRVALGKAEPSKLPTDLIDADARGVEQRASANKRDGGAGGGVGGTAAVGGEARVGHVNSVCLDPERDLVAALTATERHGESIGGRVTLALR